MIYVIRDLIISWLQIYMLNDLEKNILPYRIYNKIGRSLVYIIAMSCVLCTNYIHSTKANMFVIPIIYILVSIVIFQGNILRKIMISFCYYMLAIIPEFVFSLITNAYGVVGTNTEFQSELEKTFAVVLMKSITFILVKITNQITKRKNYSSLENRFFSILLLLPLATIVVLASIFYTHPVFTNISRIIVLMGIVLLMLSNILIFIIFNWIIEKKEEVKKIEQLYQKSKAENINLQYLNQINDENKAFLHDVNKFLCVLVDLTENSGIQKVRPMIEQLGIRIENMKEQQFCEHTLLNSILAERKFIADRKKISYRIRVGKDLKLNSIEDLDLISIVGNLLDNAIEAAEKVDDNRYVKCNIYMSNNLRFLIMEFYNNYLISPVTQNNRFISIKKNQKSHGIGLYTVEKLVKKYSGIIQVNTENMEFTVRILFPIEN